MKINSDQLLTDLINRTQQVALAAKKLHEKSDALLNQKESAESWSAFECIQHLNLYGEFYIPEISKRINTSNYSSEAIFNSGLLGNYFAKSMLPKENLNKMKTFSDKNPLGSQLNKSTIEKFINQQTEIIALLELAKSVSLNKTKTSISISNWIKLKLGDTFRVVIYHNERHLIQAQKAIANPAK